MIIAGQLKWRITVQNPTEKEDSLNFVGIEWETIQLDIRANKTRVSGAESNVQSGQVYQSIWRFRVRFFRGVHHQSRIIENGIVYEVIDVENVDNRNRELIITCKEQSRDGISGI